MFCDWFSVHVQMKIMRRPRMAMVVALDQVERRKELQVLHILKANYSPAGGLAV